MGIDGQGQGRQPVGRQVNIEDLHGAERQWPGQERRAGQQDDLAEITRQEEHEILFDILKDRPPLFHGRDNRSEIVVGERHGGGLFGHVGAGDPHGDTDISLLERRRVIDAVASHGDDMPLVLQRGHHAEFVRWRNTGVDFDVFHFAL